MIERVDREGGDGVQPDAIGKALDGVLANTPYGSLDGLLAQLKSSGLGDQGAPWLGTGRNLPINPDQIRAALGNEELQKLGTSLGIPMDKIRRCAGPGPAVDGRQAEPERHVDDAELIGGRKSHAGRGPGRAGLRNSDTWPAGSGHESIGLGTPGTGDRRAERCAKRLDLLGRGETIS
ncbi:YidB family protein [Kaistia granuli]|uniref:YidB family protein n=1 Tax=Kaistia granuli TaxID=363259 RepID=UPI000687EB5D|nr:YidB family protein [Kaistia granuli]